MQIVLLACLAAALVLVPAANAQGCISAVTKSCDGTGPGSSEKRLDDTETFDECVQLVLVSEPTADGVTWGEGESRKGECYAEFVQTGCRSSSPWTNCKIAPACAGAVTKGCDGSGPGSSEDKLDKTDSFGECVDLVKKTKVNAVGVTWGASGSGRDGECYAEYGQTECRSDKKWNNCVINPQCAGEVTASCDGSGSGSSEKKIAEGVQTFAECVSLVKTENPDANGATWGAEGSSRFGECYAEFNQSSCRSNSKWTNCKITPAA